MKLNSLLKLRGADIARKLGLAAGPAVPVKRPGTPGDMARALRQITEGPAQAWKPEIDWEAAAENHFLSAAVRLADYAPALADMGFAACFKSDLAKQIWLAIVLHGAEAERWLDDDGRWYWQSALQDQRMPARKELQALKNDWSEQLGMSSDAVLLAGEAAQALAHHAEVLEKDCRESRRLCSRLLLRLGHVQNAAAASVASGPEWRRQAAEARFLLCAVRWPEKAEAIEAAGASALLESSFAKGLWAKIRERGLAAEDWLDEAELTFWRRWRPSRTGASAQEALDALKEDAAWAMTSEQTPAKGGDALDGVCVPVVTFVPLDALSTLEAAARRHGVDSADLFRDIMEKAAAEISKEWPTESPQQRKEAGYAS